MNNLPLKDRRHRLEIFEYPGATFKTDHVSLGVPFVDFLSSHKKVKRLCHFRVSYFWMTWCDCSSASSNRPQQRHRKNMLLWLFCCRDIAFVHYLFNPTISSHWTIVFVSGITWWYGSFVCFGGSFIMHFNYLVYIFHTTIVHFIRIPVNILCNLLDFGKCLSNKQKNIFATFVLRFFAKWWIEPCNISTSVSVFPWNIFEFIFQCRLIATFSECFFLEDEDTLRKSGYKSTLRHLSIYLPIPRGFEVFKFIKSRVLHNSHMRESNFIRH